MLKVAITGNIAAGKSEVERILLAKGFSVYDTDKISHMLLEKLKSVILTAFKGFDIVENNEISRKKLGSLVFENIELKKILEDIIYPELKSEITKIFNESEDRYIFVSIPLLFEVGWQNMFDKILFVTADDDIRLNRIVKRDKLSVLDAQKRMNSQQNQSEKMQKADFIICNNGDIINLQKQVDEIIILLEDME